MHQDSKENDTQGHEILGRTFKGTKWMLYLSGSALVAGFFTNVILGRMGPEILGFYSFLMLMVALISTFYVLGGSNVVVNFLPSCKGSEKARYLFSYALIVFGFGSLFLAVSLLFPSVLRFVFGYEVTVPLGLYVSLFLPVLLAQVLIWAVLQAELEVTLLAVSQNAVSWFYFINIMVLTVVGALSAHNRASHAEYILIAVLLANIVALLIGVLFLYREHFQHWQLGFRPFLPRGFWKFTVSLHLGTLFNFILTNAAPVFILRELGLKELGYFRAASVLAAFVGWAPSVMDKSFYPSFCNLISRKLPVNDAYTKFSQLNALGSGLVALVILLFTRELLSLFGKEFGDESYMLLLLMASSFLVSAPFILVNYAVVTAYQKTVYTMVSYALGALSAIVLYGTLVPQLGFAGVGVAFVSVQIIIFLMGAGMTWYFTRLPFPTRAYLITVCALAVGLVGAYFWGDVSVVNTTLKLTLFGSFFALVVGTRLVTRNEVKELLSVVLPSGITSRLARESDIASHSITSRDKSGR